MFISPIQVTPKVKLLSRKTRSFLPLVLLVTLLVPVGAQSPARAALVSDSSNVCQLSVTSSTGVTIDSISVPVYSSGIYCVAAFKTVGTYSMTVPSTTNAVDYVVVAGGGGGASGGGVAGG